MAKTLEEITKEYEQLLEERNKINGLNLPSGKNNIYTVVYISFMESKELNITQKGILIHLLIRGGSLRVIKHSKNKIAKTLGMSVSTYSENISRLEELNYIKQYKKIMYGSKSNQADLIYLYPINDDTGFPIKSSEEEVEISIDSIVQMLNKNSDRLYIAEEKYNIRKEDTNEVVEEQTFYSSIELDKAIAIENELNKNIKVVAHLSFLENPLLNISDKIIYLYLLMRSGQYNVIFENKKNIAAKLNISLGTLNKSLLKLEELNYIVKFKRNHSITGEKSSDVLYINNYNKFTGLPDINETLMNYQLEISRKINFSNYILTRNKNTVSKKLFNETFSKNMKDLLYMDKNISEVYYETFISDIEIKITNDVITLELPKHLNSLKNDIIKKVEPLIINYAKALLKTNTDFFVTVKTDNTNKAIGI